eukprot:1443531-Amphidinium_carterae.2
MHALLEGTLAGDRAKGVREWHRYVRHGTNLSPTDSTIQTNFSRTSFFLRHASTFEGMCWARVALMQATRVGRLSQFVLADSNAREGRFSN